jgi:SAM-dependent methyltransferase
VAPIDPEEQRAQTREAWECAAGGWGRKADRVRDWGMPVSVAMVDALHLQPGQRVLELAAGPGDTGFLAAELVAPGGGSLLSSDGAEAMLDVARQRAAAAGIRNVEFRQLELEWIDLPTASVDAVLCRWGIMLIVDPDAAAREIRRAVRPGGRAAFAVWDVPERNPWATITNSVLIDLGHLEPPDPAEPGMYTLAADGRLKDLLQGAGFTDVEVSPVSLERRFRSVEEYVAETAEVSPIFGSAFRRLDLEQRAEATDRIASRVRAFAGDHGAIALPGSSLVASAVA